jgi:hypothetical protein
MALEGGDGGDGGDGGLEAGQSDDNAVEVLNEEDLLPSQRRQLQRRKARGVRRERRLKKHTCQTEFNWKLSKLREFGFIDRRRNKKLLRTHNGDMYETMLALDVPAEDSSASDDDGEPVAAYARPFNLGGLLGKFRPKSSRKRNLRCTCHRYGRNKTSKARGANLKCTCGIAHARNIGGSELSCTCGEDHGSSTKASVALKNDSRGKLPTR